MPDAAVLITKTRAPAHRPGALRRSRLLDALLEHSNRRLLLVIAPAGYGKTTLLLDLVAEAPDPVAWLTLDRGDRDPRSFIEHFVLAVQQREPAFGAATLAALRATPEVGERSTALARTLAADLHEHVPGACLVALDDFHEVNDS